MPEPENKEYSNNLKFLIHIDSDYIGDDEQDIQKLSDLFRQQWETGTVVMPLYVCRIVVLDCYGRMCYEWTRPSSIIFNCPPEKKRGWLYE